MLEQALVVKKDDRLFGRVPLNASQAASNRDSLAKVLYSELFDWVRYVPNSDTLRSAETGFPVKCGSTNRKIRSFC